MNKFKILPALCGFVVSIIVFLSIGCGKVAISPTPPVVFTSNQTRAISFAIGTAGSYEIREQGLEGTGVGSFQIVKTAQESCPGVITVFKEEIKSCLTEVKALGDPTGVEAFLRTTWRVAGTKTDQVNSILIKGP